MATRSAIGYKTPAGKVRAMGDASVLEPALFGTANHSFDTPDGDVTVFYGRDRGETGVEAKEFDTVQEFVDYYTSAGCEYFYLNAGGEWIYHDCYNVGKDDAGFPVFDLLQPKVQKEVDRLQKIGYTV